MSVNDSQELLFRYLEGVATPDEETQLRERIRSNRILAEELHLHRDLDQWLEKADIFELRETMQDIHKRNRTQFVEADQTKPRFNKRISLVTRWAAAASIILAMVGISYFVVTSSRQSLNQLYAQYNDVPVFDSHTRGPQSYSNTDSEKNRLAALFNKKEFATAASELEAAAQTTGDTKFWLFAGVAYREIGQKDAALRCLSQVPDQSDFSIDARWAEAMTYLKSNDKASCVAVLEKMVRLGYEKNKPQVGQLLNSLK